MSNTVPVDLLMKELKAKVVFQDIEAWADASDDVRFIDEMVRDYTSAKISDWSIDELVGAMYGPVNEFMRAAAPKSDLDHVNGRIEARSNTGFAAAPIALLAAHEDGSGPLEANKSYSYMLGESDRLDVDSLRVDILTDGNTIDVNIVLLDRVIEHYFIPDNESKLSPSQS